MQRGTAAQRGYDARWQRFRMWYLHEYPLCVECEKQDRVTGASEVHHIKALADGGEQYEEANLMGLCKPCHSSITARENR
jgi:5-methylcytosine-specific restriction enzyme A